MEVPVRTNDHHSIVVQIGFFGLGTSIKYKIKYCYATDVWLRWIQDPPNQKIGNFFLNLKIKDPESCAAKIIVEYNSRVAS